MRYLSLQKGKVLTVVFCFLMALLAQGSAPAGGKNEGKGHKEPCAQLMCKDKSTPVNGKCSDGSEAVMALACMQKPASCGSTCYSWQEGHAGCDTSHPSAKCTTVTDPANGSCSCKCL
jgi:hypothetical protein